MPKIIDEEKVFNAVIEMFVAHGYEGATTKDIAVIAGVNEATLFRKYGSKAELFEKAINRQFADAPLRGLEYSGDVEQDLTRMVSAYIETNAQYGEMIPALLTASSRHPELKNAFSVLWENIQIMLNILKRYQEAGVLRAESPTITLNTLIGPIMTAQMFRRAKLELPIPDITPEQYVKAFLVGRREN